MIFLVTVNILRDPPTFDTRPVTDIPKVKHGSLWYGLDTLWYVNDFNLTSTLIVRRANLRITCIRLLKRNHAIIAIYARNFGFLASVPRFAVLRHRIHRRIVRWTRMRTETLTNEKLRKSIRRKRRGSVEVVAKSAERAIVTMRPLSSMGRLVHLRIKIKINKVFLNGRRWSSIPLSGPSTMQQRTAQQVIETQRSVRYA